MMSDRVLSAGQDYRANIDSLLKEMNMGNGFGDQGKTCKRTKIPKAK